MHVTVIDTVNERDVLSYDYKYADILSVSVNGHPLSQRFSFAEVRRLVFAGVPERVLFTKTKNILTDPGDMTGFKWDDDLTVWIRGSNHNEIVRDLYKVLDHYEGHVKIKIRLQSGKKIIIRSRKRV
jgi:hypothetical protein